VAEFFLQHATNVSAGTYDCEYWKWDFWSGCSGPLELVVTGEGQPKDTVHQPQSLLPTSLDQMCPSQALSHISVTMYLGSSLPLCQLCSQLSSESWLLSSVHGDRTQPFIHTDSHSLVLNHGK
jgi:hypothetical protein